MVSCGATFTAATTDNNVVYFWGTYYKENTSATSSELPEKFPHYSYSAISHKNSLVMQKVSIVSRELLDLVMIMSCPNT